jgi:hypothetical protein
MDATIFKSVNVCGIFVNSILAAGDAPTVIVES